MGHGGDGTRVRDWGSTSLLRRLNERVKAPPPEPFGLESILAAYYKTLEPPKTHKLDFHVVVLIDAHDANFELIAEGAYTGVVKKLAAALRWEQENSGWLSKQLRKLQRLNEYVIQKKLSFDMYKERMLSGSQLARYVEHIFHGLKQGDVVSMYIERIWASFHIPHTPLLPRLNATPQTLVSRPKCDLTDALSRVDERYYQYWIKGGGPKVRMINLLSQTLNDCGVGGGSVGDNRRGLHSLRADSGVPTTSGTPREGNARTSDNGVAIHGGARSALVSGDEATSYAEESALPGYQAPPASRDGFHCGEEEERGEGEGAASGEDNSNSNLRARDVNELFQRMHGFEPENYYDKDGGRDDGDEDFVAATHLNWASFDTGWDPTQNSGDHAWDSSDAAGMGVDQTGDRGADGNNLEEAYLRRLGIDASWGRTQADGSNTRDGVPDICMASPGYAWYGVEDYDGSDEHSVFLKDPSGERHRSANKYARVPRVLHGEWVTSNDTTYPTIEPYHALLLLKDARDIIKQLPIDASPTLYALLAKTSPRISLAYLHLYVDCSFAQISRLAAHLIYYRMARPICPISITKTYQISQYLKPGTIEEAAPVFNREFAPYKLHKVLALLRQKEKFYVAMSRYRDIMQAESKKGTARPWKVRIPTPSKALQYEILVFLLRKDILVQVHTWPTLLVPHELSEGSSNGITNSAEFLGAIGKHIAKVKKLSDRYWRQVFLPSKRSGRDPYNHMRARAVILRKRERGLQRQQELAQMLQPQPAPELGLNQGQELQSEGPHNKAETATNSEYGLSKLGEPDDEQARMNGPVGAKDLEDTEDGIVDLENLAKYLHQNTAWVPTVGYANAGPREKEFLENVVGGPRDKKLRRYMYYVELLDGRHHEEEIMFRLSMKRKSYDKLIKHLEPYLVIFRHP
ncbi:Nitrogen permease regulator 3 [Spiromyces aspiralis]|uniref:Nitrogen permease regulator 3 n=1 Tax=Spiromyces aspiralis TaxID=68401 RepID=A0ACC1HGV0_9FUNG|nr:Nitrogen permease regulator 3 [Spiromyces aspiralis]